jgi:hypothetical protein
MLDDPELPPAGPGYSIAGGTKPLSRFVDVEGPEPVIGSGRTHFLLQVGDVGTLATTADPQYLQIKRWGVAYGTPYALIYDPPVKATTFPPRPVVVPPAPPPPAPRYPITSALPRQGAAILAGISAGLLFLGGFLALRRQTR